MRLFRRKTERQPPPPAACLVSLSPLQTTDKENSNGGSVIGVSVKTVGKSLSNDSIFKSSSTPTTTRPQLLHLNLKGTKCNKSALDGSPIKSPVKKGDLTASVEVVDGTGKLRGSSTTTSQKNWRLSLGGTKHRNRKNDALPSPMHDYYYGCIPKGEIDRDKANPTEQASSKSRTRNTRLLYRKPSSSEENLGSLLLSSSKKSSQGVSTNGEDEFYVNAKGQSVRKCATMKAPKSKAVDRVESIKGMILSRTKSPARHQSSGNGTKKQDEGNAKKSHHLQFPNRGDPTPNNNSPLFRSCSTSTLPSYVAGSYIAGDDPAADLDFSPNLRHNVHHKSKLHGGVNKGKMLMLGASPYYYSPSSISPGSPSKKALSLDNIASMVGSDVSSSPTTPTNSGSNGSITKKFGFPHGFVRSKLTMPVLPEESHNNSSSFMVVSSVSSDSLHVKLATDNPFKQHKSKTHLLKNNSSSSKVICKIRDQSPMSKGEAIILKSSLIRNSTSNFCGNNGKVRRSASGGVNRSSSPVVASLICANYAGVIQDQKNTKSFSSGGGTGAGVVRSSSFFLPRNSEDEIKSICGGNSGCEMLDSIHKSKAFRPEDEIKPKECGPNNDGAMTVGESREEGSMGANVNESSSSVCQEKTCQSQNVSQSKGSPSSVGSGPTIQTVGSTYISSNESGYDSDSTKNVDDGSSGANVNLNESGENKTIDSAGSLSSEPSSCSPLNQLDDSSHNKTVLQGEKENDKVLGSSSEVTKGWVDGTNAELKITKSKTAVVRRKSDLVAGKQSLKISNNAHSPNSPYKAYSSDACTTRLIESNVDRSSPFFGESGEASSSHFPSRKLGRIPCIPMESREIFRICTSSSAQSSYLIDKEILSKPETFTHSMPYGNLPPLPPQNSSGLRKRFQLFHITKETEEPLGITLLSCIQSDNGTITEHQVQEIVPGSAASRDGRFEIGDEIVNINSQRIRGMSHENALAVLNSASFNCSLLEVLIARGSPTSSMNEVVSSPNNPPSFYRLNSYPVGAGCQTMKFDTATLPLSSTGGNIAATSIKEEDESNSSKIESPMTSLLNELNQLTMPPYSYQPMPPFSSSGHISTKTNQGFLPDRNMHFDPSNPSISVTPSSLNSPTFLDSVFGSQSVGISGTFSLNQPLPPFNKKNRRHSTLTYYNADADAINSEGYGCGPFPSPHNQADATNDGITTTNYYLTTNLCTLPRKSKSKSPKHPTQPAFRIHTVVFEKGNGNKKGLGFSIVGIFVKTIFPNGQAAENCSLFEGDEILQVNDQTFQGVSHAEAIAVFKKIKTGRLVLQVLRRPGAGKPKSPKSKSCDDLESIEHDGTSKS